MTHAPDRDQLVERAAREAPLHPVLAPEHDRVGVVRVAHPEFGMGIEFVQATPQQHDQVHRMIETLRASGITASFFAAYVPTYYAGRGAAAVGHVGSEDPGMTRGGAIRSLAGDADSRQRAQWIGLGTDICSSRRIRALSLFPCSV